MLTGISAASLYPMETEKALLYFSGLGYKNFEIFFNAFSETTPEFCDKLNRMQKEHGFRILSVHPFTSALESMLLFERYDRRTEEGFELYAGYMRAAQRIGASVLVLHGQRIGAGSLSDSEYYERYHRLYKLGQSFGVTVAQENVRQFRSASPEFIRGMRKELGDECAFVLDIKQAHMSGIDPLYMLEIMGDRICHLHLSDHNAEKNCLLPGEGDYNFSVLREKLNTIGYSGAVITEVYRNAISNDSGLLQSKQIMEKFFG